MEIINSIKESIDYNKDLIAFIAGIIALIVIITALTVSVTYFCEKKTCESKAFMLNTESSFGLFKGCFIKDDGKWIDYNRYITIKDKEVKQ